MWRNITGPTHLPYRHVFPLDWTVALNGLTHHSSVHATGRPLIGSYTCHVIMSVQYGCHVSSCQWCHVAPLLPILPVDLIEQNAITFSYGVRLRWNECRWNHLDEPCDLVLGFLRSRGIHLVNLSHSTCDHRILKNILNFKRYWPKLFFLKPPPNT